MSECTELLCGGCMETFEDKEERREHRLEEHPEECSRTPYSFCAFCGKQQESQFDAYDHLIEKHPVQWSKMVARMSKVSRLKDHHFHERWALAGSACLDTKRMATLKSVLEQIDSFWKYPEKENDEPPSTSQTAPVTSSNEEDNLKSGFDPESSLAEALFAEEDETSNQSLQTHFASVSQMISPTGSNEASRDNTDTTDSSATGTDLTAVVNVIPQSDPERETVITQHELSPARKRVRFEDQRTGDVPIAVLKRPRIMNAPPPPSGPRSSTMPEIPVDIVCMSADQTVAYINLPAAYYGGRVLEAPMRVGPLQGHVKHGHQPGPSNIHQQQQGPSVQSPTVMAGSRASQMLINTDYNELRQASCSSATSSGAVSGSRPMLVDETTLARMYASDPAFKALYDSAMDGIDPNQPCSSSSIQWGFKPTATVPTTTTSSFPSHPSTSSSSIDAAIEATVAEALASNKNPRVGSHESRDPDTDYWNHRGDYRVSGNCPRCTFVYNGNGIGRRQHYIRQHYNIYYAKAQRVCVSEIDQFKCISLGESLGTPRACLFCPTDPANIRSREALLAHHVKYHPVQFASFSHELNRLQTKQ